MSVGFIGAGQLAFALARGFTAAGGFGGGRRRAAEPLALTRGAVRRDPGRAQDHGELPGHRPAHRERAAGECGRAAGGGAPPGGPPRATAVPFVPNRCRKWA